MMTSGDTKPVYKDGVGGRLEDQVNVMMDGDATSWMTGMLSLLDHPSLSCHLDHLHCNDVTIPASFHSSFYTKPFV